MASRKTSLHELLIVFLPTLFFELLVADANPKKGWGLGGCIEGERKALLELKHGLIDSYDLLSSWVDANGTADCCSNWTGVVCNNQTGNIVKLDLSCFGLGGEISDSLRHLKDLSYLDLSCNYFGGIPIPKFLGSFERLRHLNLSYAGFGGMVPPHLGNLSRLRYLDLSGLGGYGMRVSNLNWLSGLSSLEYLDLGNVNLGSKATTNNWMQAVNMLPSLLELHLQNCELNGFSDPNPFVNLTSLLVVDLSHNNFNATLSGWLFNNISATNLRGLYLSDAGIKGPIIVTPHIHVDNLQSLRNLVNLDLSFNNIGSHEGLIEFVNDLSVWCNNSLEELSLDGINGLPDGGGGEFPDSLRNFNNLRILGLRKNRFDGPFPNSIQRLTKLEILDLSENSISGPIPAWIGNFSRMQTLDFSVNQMNGAIPKSIGQLGELTKLSLDRNSWEGEISEIHFSNLTKLKHFSLHLSPPKKQSLRLHARPEWIPPFSLVSFDISNWDFMSPNFPNWLRTQKSLAVIVLKNVGISDTIPEWLWKLDISWLDLSRNQLHGELPNSLSSSSTSVLLDLSFNRLVGPLPLRFNVAYLFLGNNAFSGPIPLNIGDSSSLEIFDVSSNSLNGHIPSSMGKLKGLWVLDLSNNHLSGKIPKNNWNDLQSLTTLDLSQNKLSGGIPSWMCSKSSLGLLKLSENNLFGELSPSLRNCTGLYFLDLGNNRFSGEIPKWIGERMPSLGKLRLRGNMLTGDIPEELCWLSNSLHILDLAHNNLSGSIPQCFANLTALTAMTLLDRVFEDGRTYAFYSDHMELVVKGKDMEFESILPIVNLIDLSSNSLRGEIPKGITNLSTLGTLNLSRNQLTGRIPDMIGAMQGLETLDLSCNRLSGPIPSSMSSITSLNHLNFSHNFLSGPIPTANQFSTFNDPSIYESNLGLCGPPLSANCSSTPNDQNNKDDHQDEDEDEDEDEDTLYMRWFFISMGMGFPVGFWAICGSLALNKSWRHAYFRFIHETIDRLYVFTMVNMARPKRKIESIGVHG